MTDWQEHVSEDALFRIRFPSSQGVTEESHSQIKELHPRLCVLIRGETGYGFNLHSEKSKPGQYIRSVDTGSPADKAGLKTQDRLIEVNGVNIEDLKHSEVVAFIKSSGEEARLLVVDQEADEYFKKLGVTPTDSHVKGGEHRTLWIKLEDSQSG
ncbi:UNVERIFIED_CONTAM: hypothetical protein FKN15_000054 [Acipenser sinensis]